MGTSITTSPALLTIIGRLHLHSETGTEGGYWAIQDERFITPNTTLFSCSKCGVVWNSANETEAEMTARARIPQTGIFAGHQSCAPCQHIFELSPPELWSYEGLHVLETGDVLTIYDKAQLEKIVWEGVVALKEYPPFTEEVDGWWIHADQIRVPRLTWATWFFGEYRAVLRRSTP